MSYLRRLYTLYKPAASKSTFKMAAIASSSSTLRLFLRRSLHRCLLAGHETSPISRSFFCNRERMVLFERRESSTCSATISRIPKKVYSRMYKVRLVQPDGSSYFIRHDKPYKVITQPINPADMTEEERKERMKRLKPEKLEKIYGLEEEDEAGYDQRSWANLMKKK